MKIILNASTCVVGGGVQVAVGLCRYWHEYVHDMDVVAFVSPSIYEQCKNLPQRLGFKLIEVSVSPAKIFRGRASRRQIHQCIEREEVEMVFTVFGPSYLWLKVPEFSGFADSFAINPNMHSWDNHSWRETFKSKLSSWIKRQALRRVDEFWVETETAATGLSKRLGVPSSRVHVVSNAVNAFFQPLVVKEELVSRMGMRHRILLLASDYPHKNHRILIAIACILLREYPAFDFEFVCTIPSQGACWKSLQREAHIAGVSERIVNRGPVGVSECPRLYAEASVVIHPSLQELFSATYLEAMAAKRPLLVSDFLFSREICADAAEYFNVSKPEKAANTIVRLCEDTLLRDALIKKGVERLKDFPTGEQKNAQLVSLIRDFAKWHCLSIDS